MVQNFCGLQPKYRVFQKRALQLLKLIYIYSEDMHSVLNCHNVENTPSFTWDSYGSMRLPPVMQGVSRRP
jgi:hypothetical protein